ncbi:DUF233 protein [Operophtera brumata]|uniref:DUF233 protein n=1 Tax=Operophtera brumata TaxID=104452 RepID=A0A0L7KSD4_OPEBR|nr:DUF233 protein [Operophtera brumata]
MLKTFLFVLFTIFTTSYSEPSFRESLQKCSIKDSECLKQLSEFMVHYIAKHGVSEMGIPGLDPMHVKHQNVSVIGLVDVNLVDEKLEMSFTYPFNVEKHEDGEIYLVPVVEEAEYSYQILDKVTFAADHIYLGSLEIGNENMKAMFNFVPAKNYITDDLSQYLTD